MNEERLVIVHIATEIKQMAASVRELIDMAEKNSFLEQAVKLTEAIEDHGNELLNNVENKEKKDVKLD